MPTYSAGSASSARGSTGRALVQWREGQMARFAGVAVSALHFRFLWETLLAIEY